jgi:hypothetical protein
MALLFSFWTTLLLMTQGAFGQLMQSQPPVVTWISPPNGATFQPGATISLIAIVASYDARTHGNPAVAPSPVTQGWTETTGAGTSVGGDPLQVHDV